MVLRAVHATAESTAGFGTAVTTPTGKPTSGAAEYSFWSDLAHYQIGGETEIGICTVYSKGSPRIGGLERHLRTPEILIPIDRPFIVPLLVDGVPVENAKAFHVGIGEAIVINAGVWHGACVPVGGEESSYFVIFRRGTPHEDVEKKSVEPFGIEVR